jgi:CMP-N-acetylneuraminic acid synthetase
MKAIACIFARGGSKGLPGKNIRSLAGKPLIAWSIEHAKSVNRISRVLVSTDSEEIAQVSREYGAEVPFMRPEELASDTSPEWLSWKHLLNYLKEADGELPDVLISVPTTAPLRHPEDIDKCLDEFEKNQPDAVVTISDAHRNPYFNMVTARQDGTVSIVNSTASISGRRQDAPVVYDMTTVAYAVSPSFVLSSESIFDGRVRAVHIPVHRAIDIDTLLDFEIAEFLMNRNQE